MKRIYLAAVHVLLAIMLWKSNFLDKIAQKLGAPPSIEEVKSQFHHRTVHLQERAVGSVPDDAVIFIGDSITQGLCVLSASPLAVNYGIASDTTAGVRMRIHKYLPAIERCKCVVLAIGANDSAYRSVEQAVENYRQILAELPEDCPVIISSILPQDARAEKVTERRVEFMNTFNARLQEVAAREPNVMFLDNSSALDTDNDGRLDQQFHDGDGLHLNTAGNLAWAASLKTAIEAIAN